MQTEMHSRSQAVLATPLGIKSLKLGYLGKLIFLNTSAPQNYVHTCPLLQFKWTGQVFWARYIELKRGLP